MTRARLRSGPPQVLGATGPLVALADYDAGNMVSIGQALVAAGARVRVADSPDGLEGVDALVVPGVGAAAPAMARLRRRGLVEPIQAWVLAGRPTLGICLGFQLLFDHSEEDGARTLGLLPGVTAALRDAPTLPHTGWNSVEPVRRHPILDGIPGGSHFYFVHSYAPVPADEGLVLARSTHGRAFVSAVASGSLVGLQFHPEKSAEMGLRLLKNFVAGLAARDGVAGSAAAGYPAAPAGSAGASGC